MSGLSYLADMIRPAAGGVLSVEEQLHNANVFKRHLIESHREEVKGLNKLLDSALYRARTAETELAAVKFQLSQMQPRDAAAEAERTAQAVRGGRLD